MPDEPTLSPAAFGRAFQTFLEQAVREEKAEDPPFDPPFVAHLADHLDADPRELPILTAQFSVIEHPNVRAALDAWISGSSPVSSRKPDGSASRREGSPPGGPRRRSRLP